MAIMLFHLLFIFFIAPTIASINAHGTKLSSSKHYYRDYFDSSICLQEASCIPLQNATCFGTSLPYASTSIDLAEDSISQFEVQDNLALWQGLRSIPRCWAVIQPLLCAVYMPKCENGSLFLPSEEMCRITRGPCRFVEAVRGWPKFLQCENKKLFPPRCRNPLQEIKFNTSYKCVPPLVETDNPDNFFDQVQGCGLQCENPFYSKEEHESTQHLIKIFAFAFCAVTTFTVLTFIVSKPAASRYPAVIILYINICLVLVSLGWIIQFLPGVEKKDIICSQDGTIRRKHPRLGAHFCNITFFLIYYFLMASLVWFVIFAYAWHIFLKQNGAPVDLIKKQPYFHICAWSLPVILTTAVIAIAEVDGDSMSGICFVGYSDINMRIVFLLAPICAAALIGGYFMAYNLYTLIKVKYSSANNGSKKRIQHIILKIGIISASALIFIIATFVCHAYDFLYRKEWEESLKDYIICLAMNSANRYPSIGELPKCHLKSKPWIGIVHIQLFCLFGYGIIMSSWVFTRKSIETWKCVLSSICKTSVTNTPAKHVLIKDAFRRRHEINQGRYSLCINSLHDDPIGLDVASIASRDLSTSWALAFPHFIERRNAIAGPLYMPRQYSSASDMSRHISVDSFNQQNLDSLSMQMSEQEIAFALRRQRRKTRKEREAIQLKSSRFVSSWFPRNRRGSDTSLQSSLVTASVAAAAKKAGIIPKVTKSTSTGDLGVVSQPPRSVMLPPVMMPPVRNRPQIQRPVINPPFTHGMTDNSHCSRVPSVSSTMPRISSVQRCTPNQCTVMPNSLAGIVHPNVYSGSYDMLNPVPWYLNSGMYLPMNNFISSYGYGPEYMYNPNFHYSFYASCNTQHQQDILPTDPIADSASETNYLPIIMTDSECTDTGMRSYDESQLLTAQLMMQEHLAKQMAAHEAAADETSAIKEVSSAAQNTSQQKAPNESETDTKIKTQFFEKMWPFKTNPTSNETLRPPSVQEAAHSEVPPPSPVESSKSLNVDLDDVFIDPEETKKNEKNISVLSLPHPPETANVDNVFYKIKTKFQKFRRASSYINSLEKIGSIELTSKVRHSSLLQLSKTDSSIKNLEIQKSVLKEKWLHVSEGISLINGDTSAEHVSR